MTTVPLAAHGDAQAHRLEAVVARITTLVQQPDHARRLRDTPGPDEWSVLQTIGHMAEMIPFWLRQSRTMIDAAGPELPRFGRSFGDAERLAGPARGASANPAELLAHLQSETRSGAAVIRALSADQRAKQGLDGRGETVSVDDVVDRFIVSHAEGHLSQIEQSLGAQA